MYTPKESLYSVVECVSSEASVGDYWFRLYNTTLFFYTRKHGSAVSIKAFHLIILMMLFKNVLLMSD